MDFSTHHRTTAADRRRIKDEADQAWTWNSVTSELLVPVALALVALFAPFEIDPGRRLVFAALIFAIAPVGLLISAVFSGRAEASAYIAIHCTVAVSAGFLDPHLWHASTVGLTALLAMAIVTESPRSLALLGGLSYAALAISAENHAESPTNWYLSLIVAVAILGGSAVWFNGWEASRDQLIASHDEMLERARTFSWTIDRDSLVIVTVAGNVQGVLGYRAEELLGTPITEFTDSDPELREWTEADERHSVITATHRDGHVVTLHEVQVSGDDTTVVRGVFTDITEAARATDALRYQAEHDSLTDLYNRKAIRARADQALQSSTHVALLVIDLDRFKEVNDTLGHATGDHLLSVLSKRFFDVFGDRATVARIGGDEFALLLPGADMAAAMAAAREVDSLASAPIQIDGFTLSTSASVGIALAPEHGTTYDELLRSADIASYAAKREGGGVRIFDTVPDEMSRRRLRLVSEMSTAVDAGEFELFMQPKVRLSDGAVIGAEGLARWRHSEFGILPPADFFHGLAVASDHHKFTNEMVRQAIDFLAMLPTVARDLHVAVNLGAMSLRDEGLPERVAAALRSAGVSGSSLVFEVVESDLVQADRLQTAVIDELKALGIRISIDDFGTGYSNFSQLKTLAADEVKIDRSLIAGLVADEHDSVIVRSMIDLTRQLGYSVVAEGVESGQQAAMLGELGCELAQGFWYSRPTSQSDFLHHVTTGILKV